MVFRKDYAKRKQEPTNQLRKSPIVSFRCNQRNFIYLSKYKYQRDRSKEINKSIEMYRYLRYSPKAFLVNLIPKYYTLVKHLLRQIGKTRK